MIFAFHIFKILLFGALLICIMICMGQACSLEFPALYLKIVGALVAAIAIMIFIQKRYKL